MENKKLREIFKKLNKTYFNDETKLDKIYYKTMKGKERKVMGKYIVYTLNDGKEENVIQINSLLKKSKKLMEKTLIHEMCHYFHQSHGNLFNKKYTNIERQYDLRNNKNSITIHNA